MTNKKTNGNRHAKSPGLKQRVTLLSRRERNAADSVGGVVDASVPALVLELLPDSDPTLVEDVGSALGRWRLHQVEQANALSVAERRKQAESTAAMARALGDRISNLDPYVAAAIEDTWWPSVANAHDKKTFYELRARNLDPWLLRLAALCDEAAEHFSEGKRGRRNNWPREALVRELVRVLKEHGTEDGPAKRLAREIADASGARLPKDDRNRRRIAQR